MINKQPQKARKSAWPTGVSGNPNGRPPGALTKINKAVKEAMQISLSEFVDNKFEEIQEIFETLNEREKLSFFLQILPYAKPRLAAIKQETTIKSESGFEHLSDSELTQFIIQVEKSKSNTIQDESSEETSPF